MPRKLQDSPDQSGRLYQKIAAKLASSIHSGKYPIGERLPAERDLAEQFEVSRTTIREATIALEIEGLVEVKQGSGVYVRKLPQRGSLTAPLDVGPFELIEARLLIESEAAALAAMHISDGELDDLEALLVDMKRETAKGHGEAADRKFHETIAAATRNNAVASMVDSLWEIRIRSPECIRLFARSKAKGYLPIIGEHRAILDALRKHDAQLARQAMQDHLRRVLGYLLDAGETEAVEAAKARAREQRRRFLSPHKIPITG